MIFSPSSRETEEGGRRHPPAAALLAVAATAVVVLGAMTGGKATDVALTFEARADTVIERVAGGLSRSSASLRSELKAAQTDAGQAAETAQAALDAFARSGNARFVGIAKTALAPWLSLDEPPADIWLLRGRIAQTEHRFAEAAADLDAMTQTHPESTASMLLAADAWRRAGRIDAARQACLRVALRGRPELARVCSAEVLMSLGDYEKAAWIVAEVLNAADPLPAEERRWVSAVYADTLIANGDTAAAADVLASDLHAADATLAIALTRADSRLALSQPEKALALLEGYPASAAVLLRRAAAARSGLQPSTPEQSFEWLRARLHDVLATEAQAGSDELHLREQSLTALLVDDDTESALELALDNWALQKSWEDAELVMMTARRADRPAAAQPVIEWRQRWSSAEQSAGEST